MTTIRRKYTQKERDTNSTPKSLLFSPTSTLVESTLQSFKKVSCSGGALLSYPFLFVSFCDSTPSYVRHVFAFPHMWAAVWRRPEPETQMAPRWRQITEQTSATLHYTHTISLSLPCFSFSHVKLSIARTSSLTQSASAVVFIFFNSPSLSFTRWICVLSCSRSLKLWASHSPNLSLAALAPSSLS